MSVLVVPVPEPAPLQVPAVVAALRGQIARGASDAVLLRIAGGLAEYRRLARDFGLRGVADQPVASGPKPAVPTRAIVPPRAASPPARTSTAGPDQGPADSSQPPPDDALHAEPAEPPAVLPAAAGAADHDRGPPVEGGGMQRPSRRKPKHPDDVTALLRDIARVRRDLAALERRRP